MELQLRSSKITFMAVDSLTGEFLVLCVMSSKFGVYCCFGFSVTILCNKFDGHPKGFAYIEFGDKDSIQTAMALDESLFRGRQIKVCYYFYHV